MLSSNLEQTPAKKLPDFDRFGIFNIMTLLKMSCMYVNVFYILFETTCQREIYCHDYVDRMTHGTHMNGRKPTKQHKDPLLLIYQNVNSASETLQGNKCEILSINNTRCC